MRDQIFRTRLTELFGISHPILCGGMLHLSDARYVAAVALREEADRRRAAADEAIAALSDRLGYAR